MRRQYTKLHSGFTGNYKGKYLQQVVYSKIKFRADLLKIYCIPLSIPSLHEQHILLGFASQILFFKKERMIILPNQKVGDTNEIAKGEDV